MTKVMNFGGASNAGQEGRENVEEAGVGEAEQERWQVREGVRGVGWIDLAGRGAVDL